LYEFKGSSPKYIRDKFGKENIEFESHSLRFCSRCTKPIIDAFHDIVNGYGLNDEGNERIKKDFICYLPEKKKDGDLNSKVYLMESVTPGSIPYKIREQLEQILETQKIKSVLIIGEAQTCQRILLSIARKFRSFGFSNVDHAKSKPKAFNIDQKIVSAYRFLTREINSILAWRLLAGSSADIDLQSILTEHYSDPDGFLNDLTDKFKKLHIANSKTIDKLIHEPPSKVKAIADSSIEKVQEAIVIEKSSDRDLLMNQLVSENNNLPRPLSNLEVTVCSILRAKGLGADVVFLIGFDQGKLPSKKTIQDSEIYQMLVALTRAKKRIYFINTVNSPVSKFIDSIDKDIIQKI